jgi:hypothetical protein
MLTPLMLNSYGGTMGWFKEDKNETPGVFVVAGERMPERHYGYWSVRWSVDNAFGMIESITSMDSGPLATSLIARVKVDPWKAVVQGQALYIAMYLSYPKLVLKVPERVSSEMNIGFLDGLKDLLGPNREPIDATVQSYMRHKVEDYRLAITDELSSQVELGVLDFTGGATCDALVRSLCSLYSSDPMKPDTFDILETTMLCALFGQKPTKFMLTLKNEFHITYQRS